MKATRYTLRLDEDRIPMLVREMSTNFKGRPQGALEDTVIILRDLEAVQDMPQESFYLFCLNSRRKQIGYFKMFVGCDTYCVIDTKLVFTSALAAGAHSIIVAHNHPSGDPSPSEHDVELTKAVYDAGQIVGINLLDHLVIGEKDYYSFAQNRPELLGGRS